MSSKAESQKRKLKQCELQSLFGRLCGTTRLATHVCWRAHSSADGVAEPRRALLMTAVWGTTRPWLLAASARLFVESALDIVVIGDAELVRDAPNEPTAAQLRVEFVDALRVRRTKAWDEFAVQRFEHFASTLRRLRAEGRNYTHVMVCDAGDVLFQADPFARVPPNSIVFSLEAGIKVSEQPHNAGWVRNLLADGGNGSLPRGSTAGRPYDGCALLDEIGDEIVSCSGATLGTVDAMETYLDDMAQIINRLPVRLDLGMDQVSLMLILKMICYEFGFGFFYYL